MSKVSLTNAQISLIIAKIESGLTLNQFLYLGTDFWPYIRISLIARLKVQHRKTKKTNKFLYVLAQIKISLIKIIQSFFYSYFLDRTTKLKCRTHPVMILAPYEHRFDKVHNGYLNKHADALRRCSEDGEKIGLIEYSFSYKNRKKSASKSLLLNYMPEFLALKYRFLSVFSKVRVSENSNWSEGVRHINNVFETKEINIVITEHNLLLEVQRVCELANYCEQLLTNYKVKHFINVVYCNYITIAFILAAKRLGLKTTEYQHGSQDETHPHYTNWSLIGKSGYQLLPENYWVWSKNTQSYMQKWSDKTDYHRITLTGNFYISAYLKGYVKSRKKQKVILLTLQELSLLPDFIFEVIEKSSMEWQWWIREHPRDKMDDAIWKKFELHSHGNVINVSHAHLYELFSDVSVHITGYSTCAFEAELFDIPTIFFAPTAQTGYQSLIACCDHLVFAKNTQQILSNIDVLADTTVTPSAFIEVAKHSIEHF